VASAPTVAWLASSPTAWNAVPSRRVIAHSREVPACNFRAAPAVRIVAVSGCILVVQSPLFVCHRGPNSLSEHNTVVVMRDTRDQQYGRVNRAARCRHRLLLSNNADCWRRLGLSWTDDFSFAGAELAPASSAVQRMMPVRARWPHVALRRRWSWRWQRC